MKCNVEVMNVPKDHDKYIVARLNEGKLWYWGSWEDNQSADLAAREISGIVVEKSEESEINTDGCERTDESL